MSDLTAATPSPNLFRKRATDLLLPVIIALAGFLRLFELQYGQYGSDDERLWAQALRQLAAHALPTSGIRSSIGANNGPGQVLLVMPGAATFPGAPLAGSAIVALVNTAAVYFAYRLVAEFFGRRPALIAALLFAVNSWAVIYSRRMQGQDMLVPFQVLFFWSAARWLARGRWRDLALMFVWLAVLTQVYILGLLHLATLVVVLLVGWRHLRRPGKLLPAAGGAALWAALSAPYFVSALLPALSSFGNVSGGHPRIDTQSLVLALTMASHKGFQTIAGQAGAVLDSTSGIEGALVWLEEALFAAGFLYGALRLARQMRAGSDKDCPPVLGLLLAWGAIPTALFARHSVDLYPYYFVAVVPLPAIFTALLLDGLWAHRGRIALAAWPAGARPAGGLRPAQAGSIIASSAAAMVLAVLTANALLLAGIFFAVIPGYWTKNDYGLPYHYTFDIAPRVQRLVAGAGIGRVYVDGDMDPSEVMSSVLARAGLDVLWLDDYRTPELAAPPEGDPPALYVTMADDTDTAAFLREQFAGQQRLSVPLPGEGVTIRAYELAPEAVRSALARRLDEPLNLRVANGTTLDAFGADRRLEPGGSLRAAISWSWPGKQRPEKLRYAIFGHLVDGNGKVLAETDNPLVPSVDWRAGEQLVQWLVLPIPADAAPGRYALDVGVYAQDGVARQQLSDRTGKALGGSLTLGGFIVPPPPANAPAGAPEASLGDGIALQAHQATSTNGTLQLDFAWRASATPTKDYTVFVHLLDAAGHVVAQADSQPRSGAFPTSAWRAGDVVADRYALSAPPGQYTVEAGMYYLPTLERLPGGPVRFDVSISG